MNKNDILTSRNATTAGVALGLVCAIFIVSLLFTGEATRFDEAALGDRTESYFAQIEGVRIHCTDPADSDKCIAGAQQQPHARRLLWLGNSQIHAINQRRQNEPSAPEALHRKLRPSGDYLVAFSEPNASLQEHLALFAYLAPRLKPRALILPIVFDDFRETGIRTEILPALKDPAARASLGGLDIGKTILAEADASPADNGDLAGIAETLQERSERTITDWLNANWEIWALRAEARGQTFLFLYQLRNTILGIKPTSARRMIQPRFEKNWAALEAITSLARASVIHVHLYIAPLRNDVRIPYVEGEYLAFKQRLLLEFGSRPGITVLNLERVVANELWGTKEATNLKREPEYDFMHFQGPGHEALAEALYQAISTTEMPKR